MQTHVAMIGIAWAGVGGVLLSAADPADVKQQELSRLRGAWQVVEATMDGKRIPAEVLKKAYVRFDEGKVTYHMPPSDPNQVDLGPRTGLFDIDPGQKPKTLDFFEKENPKERALGIYDLKGDELKMVIADPIGAPRPDRFAGKSPDPDPKKRPVWTFLTLQRRK